MPRLFLLKLFERKVKRPVGQRRRAADSGFVGVSTHSASKGRDKNHLGSSAFRRGRHCSDVQIRCGHVTISEEAPLLMRRQKAPKYNNASITGRLTCSYSVYEKIDLALQLFFCLSFVSLRQLLRFDFNAFV